MGARRAMAMGAMALAAVALAGTCAVSAVATPQPPKTSQPGPLVGGRPVEHLVPSIAGRSPASDPDSGVYNYVAGYSEAPAKGASVTLPQSQPKLAPNAGHSLIELAVESADGQQIVEVGWIVGADAGTSPRLFVFYWRNGNPTCYDTCGFVALKGAVRPGSAVARRKSEEYGIKYSGGRWWVSYDNKRIGFFPASLWQDQFTQTGLIQTFGEINATSSTTCTQMGNGRFGTNPGADEITDFRLKGAASPSELTLQTPTLRKAWDFGRVSKTAFRLGGPGTC